MKVSCDIIKDLLPLYAENLTSQASNEMVDEHLCQCDVCTKELGALKKAPKVPVEVDTNALKRVGNTIRRRRILAVMTALLFAVTVYLSVAMLLDAKIYLTAEQAVKSVEALEDGRIRILWSDEISIAGTCSLGYAGDDSDLDTGNYGIIVWKPLANLLFSKELVSYDEMMAQMPEKFRNSYPITKVEYNSHTYQLEGDGSSCNFWYCSAKDGTAQTLLWDAGNPAPEGAFVDVNYHLAYYCIILAVIAIVLALPGRKWRGKWYGELCKRLSILFLCQSLSVVIVCAGQFMELYGEFTENVIDSTIVALPMTLTVLFARQIHLLNKQDKGE